MTSPLKIGVAGYAQFGRSLTRQFRAIEGVEVVGVFNRGGERRKQAEADGCRTFDDYGRLLAEPGLDAVVIATANAVHAGQCTAAARAGKHIFCEKPLALDMASFDAVLAASRQAGVVTHLDMSLRFDTGCRRMIEIVRAGRLGRILTLWAKRCRGYGLWAAGKRHVDIVNPAVSGGWNLHHNIHGTDLLLHLAGEKVVEVYCRQTRSAADTPCEEIIVAIVTFAGGATGSLSDSTSILREDYIGVIGEKGSVLLRHGGELVIKMEDGTEPTEPIPSEGGFPSSCQAFVDACRGTGRQNIPFEEGRHPLEVVLAMNRSAAEGRIVRLV